MSKNDIENKGNLEVRFLGQNLVGVLLAKSAEFWLWDRKTLYEHIDVY